MTEMFGEAWSPMSVPDLAPDDDDEDEHIEGPKRTDRRVPRTCEPSNETAVVFATKPIS